VDPGLGRHPVHTRNALVYLVQLELATLALASHPGHREK
jgi:hypothetical protein